MIESKNDLYFYIKEDKKVNMPNTNIFNYIVHALYKSEHYMAFKYLKSLRKYEYALNCSKGIFGKIDFIYRKWKWRRLSIKYNICIGPNMVGYGFRLPHIVGGGNYD